MTASHRHFSYLTAWEAVNRYEAMRRSEAPDSQLDRRRVGEAEQRRERYFQSLHKFLGPEELLCIPTTPALAPRKGDPPRRSSSGTGYYPRTLSLTSVAGMCRLPQISLPITDAGGVPVGLSLLARHGQDSLLLQAAKSVEKYVCR